MSKTASEYESPIDKALTNRPRGAPRSGVMKPRKPVPTYPLDFHPKMASTERAQQALASVQRTWDTFRQLDEDGEDRREIATRADPAIERAGKDFDSARNYLKGELKKIEQNIERETLRGVNPAVLAEVRTYLRSLGDKALTHIQNAVVDGDNTLAAAVLYAPPYLSGLTSEMHANVRRMVEQKFAPKETVPRAQIEADLARLDKAQVRFNEVIVATASDWTRGNEKLKGFEEKK